MGTGRAGAANIRAGRIYMWTAASVKLQYLATSVTTRASNGDLSGQTSKQLSDAANRYSTKSGYEPARRRWAVPGGTRRSIVRSQDWGEVNSCGLRQARVTII